MKRPRLFQSALLLSAGAAGLCALHAAADPLKMPVPMASLPTPLDMGGKYLAANDYPNAIHTLEMAMRNTPGNAGAGQMLAVAYLYSGHSDRAVKVMTATLARPDLDRDSRSADLYLLGKAHYDEYVKDYTSFQDKAARMPGMQQLLTQMSSHTYEAPPDVGRCIAQHAEHPEEGFADNDRGNYLVTETGDEDAGADMASMRDELKRDYDQLQKSLQQSEDAFQSAKNLDSHLPGLYDGLGLVCAAQGYPGEARQDFLTELSQTGPSGPVYVHLGEIDASQGFREEAVHAFRRGIALAPELSEPYDGLEALFKSEHDEDSAHWARGMAALVKGDLNASAAALAAAKSPTADLLQAQARLAVKQNRPLDAQRLLDQAAQLTPNDPSVLAARGDMEASRGKYDAAIQSYKSAAALDANRVDTWYGLGCAYDGQKDAASARDDYRQALQINPNHALARLRLAEDEVSLNRKDLAAADLREYIRRFPTAANVYSVQARLASLETK